MYTNLVTINHRPGPWEFYTADILWTDPHIAGQMLTYHLNEHVDAASRNHAFIQKSVSWLTGRFTIGNGTDIADFGCGPGLYTLPLARSGAKVTGIDFSRNSLDYARKKADESSLDVTFVQTNYLEYRPEHRFDVIIMIMCDFCALSPSQQSTLLGTFRESLKPGGSLVLDVYTPVWYHKQHESAFYEHNHMNGFWSENDYYTFVNTFKYDVENLVLNKYIIIEETRTRSVYNWLQSFSRDSIRKTFAENGMEIVEWYSDVAGSPYDPDADEMAIVAQRK